MKRQIRSSVFETNSSSMHSLVVKKKSEYFTAEEAREDIYINDKGKIRIDDEKLYFGRHPFKFLASVREKSLYVLASMCRFKGDAVYNEVCDVIKSYIPEFTDFDLKVELRDWFDLEDGENKMKKWYGEGNYKRLDNHWIGWKYYTGEVDEDILTAFLKKENITITEFLKNKRYCVVVDGDEYYIYGSMKENGLINTEEIEKEYDNYDHWRDEHEED